jgi:enoyl-CoA hydratase/carnithine racemase
MTDYTTISVVREDAVDWLTLNRPERLNALDDAMVRELWHYFDGLQSDYSRRIVVMRGNGKAFCAGLDLVWVNSGGATIPAASLEQATFCREWLALRSQRN